MLSCDRPTMGQSNQIPNTSDHLPVNAVPSKSMANGVAHAPNQQPETEHNHIWLVTGPAGCGKSTVAQFIAHSLNLPFLEGDDVGTLPPRSCNSTLTQEHSTTPRPMSIRWPQTSLSRMLTVGTGLHPSAAPLSPSSLVAPKVLSSPALRSKPNTEMSSASHRSITRSTTSWSTSSTYMPRKKSSWHVSRRAKTTT